MGGGGTELHFRHETCVSIPFGVLSQAMVKVIFLVPFLVHFWFHKCLKGFFNIARK